MKELLIVQDKRVLLKKPGEKGFRKEVQLTPFMKKLAPLLGGTPGEAVAIPPYGAKAMWRNGTTTVVQIELPPQLRTVYWILEGSEKDYGSGVKDKARNLAFPYIEIFVKFQNNALSGDQCLYYRTEPVESMDDVLLQSNLLNVSDFDPGEIHGQKAWFCSQYFSVPASASWKEKIAGIHGLLWQWTFSKSSEHHEGNSYWKYNHGIDPRISTIDAWEKASKKDPFFMLKVDWPKMHAKGGGKHGGTVVRVRDVVNNLLGTGQKSVTIEDTKHLINIMRGMK